MDDPSNTTDYTPDGLPLTPAVIKALIVELFDGQAVERRVIVSRVDAVHRERGGRPARTADLPRSVKKALSLLKSEGVATNPQLGFWRIDAGNELGQVTRSVGPQFDIDDEKSEAEPVQADYVIGSGAAAVYVYYLSTYRTLAEKLGDDSWPCKIGRTEGDPHVRILSQVSTGMPEKPHVAIILQTSEPQAWEKALHSVLTIRGCDSDAAPGTEWFDTSPEEILEIIRAIDPDLMEEQTPSDNNA